ncbi:MAG: hypothetical protein ACOZQL_24525 [Myxococcota bacterium]
MFSLRKLSAVLLALLAGCRDERLAATEGELLVQPARVVLERVWVGHEASVDLELQNTSRRKLDVTLSVAAPWEIEPAIQLAGGERRVVPLRLRADRTGHLATTLSVTFGEQVREVTAEAEAFAPPECPASDCHVVTFDAASGECRDVLADDGTACGATNQCLVSAVCMGGQCLGTARDCGDQNACTADACDPATGCIHDAVACPASSNPCEVPVCDPQRGCAVAPAADGAACGPNDCLTARVCIGGQCVTRTAPEGSQCAAATACRGPGQCRGQRCELPAPGLLPPQWVYTPEEGHTVAFHGHADQLGNLYATESWVGPQYATGPQQGAAEDRAGAPFVEPPTGPINAILSLTPNGTVRFRVPAVYGCSGCAWGLSFAIDSAAHRLFFVSMSELRAHSTDDGRLLWRSSVTSGLPGYDLRPDGGPAFSWSPPLLIGDDAVGVPVIEGYTDHHSYVQVFDRVTGAARWQFHRKGHLYTPGVAASGELWTSSANCWAVAGEMTRVDPQGHQQASQFVEWIPSVYGADFALGSRSGRTHRLDSSFTLVDLSPLVPSVGTQLLVSGAQLVSWEQSARQLRSVDLVARTTTFTFSGVQGNGPEFELLRDGGVGWTAQVPDGGVLGAVDGRGVEVLACPLPLPVDSPTAIVRGRAYVESNGTIVAYDAPGLDVEPQGWVSRQGSLERGGRAR